MSLHLGREVRVTTVSELIERLLQPHVDLDAQVTLLVKTSVPESFHAYGDVVRSGNIVVDAYESAAGEVLIADEADLP
jgi:hypothetical protein